ncbi:MAG: lipid-A-disaccharide synthase [Candidatus Aureabacteria bacterium]|nr:lipid-A-disaccharide synthase [Candidatus Auribacterota bacterium]
MMINPSRIFIFCGEQSSDAYGALIAKELYYRRPDLSITGVGGPHLKNAGVSILRDNSDLAIVGFWEAVKHYFKFRKLMNEVVRHIQNEQVSVVVLIDYPGFNLRLAKRLKHLPVKVVYYISPQLWAWGKGRLREMKKLIHHMIVIFEFEKKIYQDMAIPVTFVGHPLMDLFDPFLSTGEIKAFIQRKEECPLIGFLPGSRHTEVSRLLPVFCSSMVLLKKKIPDIQFVISASSKEREQEILAITAPFFRMHDLEPVPVFSNDVNQIMKESTIVVVASGTASFQTALHAKPMVVVYRMGFISYWITRLLIQVKNIAMVNIIAEKTIVPELVQDSCNPERITEEVSHLIENGRAYRETVFELDQLKEKIGYAGASERASEVILRILNETQDDQSV